MALALRFRWWWLAWIVPLVLAIGHTVWCEVLEARFEAGLEAIREAEEPVELVELNRPPMNEEDNAAPLLRRFGEWMEAHPQGEWSLNDPDFLFDEDRAEALAWVEQSDECLPLLRAAAAKPGWDFGVDWRDGVETMMPAIPLMQQARDLVSARVEFGSGESLEELAILFDLARNLDRNTIIGCLVRWTVEQQACELLKKLASREAFDAQAARAMLDARILAAEEVAQVRDALLGERVIGLSLIRRWAAGEDPFSWLEPDGDDSPSLAGFLVSSRLVRPLAYLDGLNAQAMFADYLGLLDLPPGEAPACAEEIRNRYDLGIRSIHTTLLGKLPPRFLLERCRHLAHLRVARAGLAVLCGEAPTGIDPFTGGPLKRADGRISAAVPEPEGWDPELNAEIEFDYRIHWDLPRR